MNKEFIPFDEALALKELGFDELCFGYWYTEQEEFRKIDIQLSSIDFLEGEPDYILAPTYSQAFRFFREKGYDITFRKMDYGVESNFTGYYYTIYNGNEMIDIHGADKRTKTYEEAESVCLMELIKIAKDNK